MDTTDNIYEKILKIEEKEERLFYLPSLIEYGFSLINNKEYERANDCFKLSYEIDPTNYKVCFQLFLRNVCEKNYEEAFKYFEHIYASSDVALHYDSNLYLYLLSLITDIPDNYKNIVKTMSFEDVRVHKEDFRFKNRFYINGIREKIINLKLYMAKKDLQEYNKINGKVSKELHLTNILLSQALDVFSLEKENIKKYMETKDYEGLINYLEELNNKHNLTDEERLILTLANNYLKIRETGVVPEVIISSRYSLSGLIENNDFISAMNLCYEKNMTDDDAIFSLLKEINKLIKNDFISLASVFDILKSHDKLRMDEAIRQYLEEQELEEYTFLIKDLINISLLEQDELFVKPISTLMRLKELDCWDFSQYIEDFLLAVKYNNLEIAECYLNIIMESKEKGFLKGDISFLEHILNNCYKKEVNEQIVIEEKPLNKQENNSVVESTNLEVSGEVLEKDYKKIVDQKRKLMEEKGLVILGEMVHKDRRGIYDVVNASSDITCFSVGVGPLKRVVLKYSPYKNKFIDIKGIFPEIDKAKNEDDYETVLAKYKEILYTNNPRPFIYAKIAYLYWKKFYDKETARNYFIAATEKARKMGGVDYTNLIFELESTMGSGGDMYQKEEYKPFVKMKESEFEDKEISDVEKVVKFGEMFNMGYSIMDIFEMIDFSEEQKCIVLLTLAKEFYYEGNMILGDKHMRMVEHFKNKSEVVKEIFREITEKKKFYQYRKDTYTPLILTR